MENTEHKQLTVTLAGRPYPLKIKAADEAILRKIVKDVNEKVNRFRLAYPTRDMQDCIAMATLAFAVDFHKARQQAIPQSNPTPPVSSDKKPDVSPKVERKISELDELLNDLL